MKPAEIDALYEDVGRRIVAARTKAGMTQGELAEMIGTRRTSVTNVEAGRQRFPLHRLFEVADELGVPVRELLPPHEPKPISHEQLDTLHGIETEEDAKRMLRLLRAKLRAGTGERNA